MFTFVEVSKNTYPYRTLHVDTCSVLKRAKYQHVLNLEQVRRLDSVRIDYCSRCMPVVHRGPHSEYSAAQREFWSIQRAFKDQEAETWRVIHAARKVMALRLALAEAESQVDLTNDLFLSVERDVTTSGYSPLEVTVGRR